jgi:hypothetical protein
MVFKPNYNQQRAERDRNKQAKKAETDAAPPAAQDPAETSAA